MCLLKPLEEHEDFWENRPHHRSLLRDWEKWRHGADDAHDAQQNGQYCNKGFHSTKIFIIYEETKNAGVLLSFRIYQQISVG